MKLDIVRAWKDESYRQSLSEEQLGLLPVNPAGELELSEADLEIVFGGVKPPKTVHKSLLNIIKVSNIHLFSLNILASPLNQTCIRVD